MGGTRRYALGIDASTQSMTGVVIDAETGETACSVSIPYRDDRRTAGCGFEHDSLLMPPREPGEAEQPPRLFAVALDALLSDLKAAGAPLGSVSAVNVSGQQHGHVYLSARAGGLFASLRSEDSARESLDRVLSGAFAYGAAPIWKTANTARERDEIIAGAGGLDTVIRLTGSALPLRFSGPAIRLVARRYPEAYAATWRIPQISTYVACMLSGDASVPLDYGNACGVGLMNYAMKRWDDRMVAAAGRGLEGGPEGLAGRLPELCHPLEPCGKAAGYFVAKYGLSATCLVLPGSGDNPQTKNIAEGDLLSLGTSFVYMMDTPGGEIDSCGSANSMYDGFGRPFNFACRTNGALSWERVRAMYGIGLRDFEASDRALRETRAGSSMAFWHPDAESFPLAGRGEAPVREAGIAASFGSDYAAVVDSSLGLLYAYSRAIGKPSAAAAKTPLYAFGGPTGSDEVLKRMAGIWNRPVLMAGQAGAALGAALAAATALYPEAERDRVVRGLRSAVTRGAATLEPDPALVSAYHGTDGTDGYLSRLVKFFERNS